MRDGELSTEIALFRALLDRIETRAALGNETERAHILRDLRMLAAAPELLEFVRQYVKDRPDVVPHGCCEYCPPCISRRLIRRIEGEE